MPRTIASLLERALSIVDEVGSGQSASAEDSDFVLATLQSLLAELSKREILGLYIDPVDMQAEDIPDELWGPIADILAVDISPTYRGVNVDDAIREGKIIGCVGLRRLARHMKCSGPIISDATG